MKTKKELAEYLAGYIEHEMLETLIGFQEILEEGLDAFESIENCTIQIKDAS